MARRLVKYDFDPIELIDDIDPRTVDENDRVRINELVSDFVIEQVLSKVADGESPVEGFGKWQSLSKDYKNYKEAVTGSSEANLDLSGDLLGSLHAEFTRNKIRITVDESQQGKADGHNNFTGLSKLPLRRFIPDEKNGETWDTDIIEGIETIVRAVLDER